MCNMMTVNHHVPLPAVKPKLPEDFEANTWAKLRQAVLAVHKRQPVSCSLEELYRVSLHCQQCSV